AAEILLPAAFVETVVGQRLREEGYYLTEVEQSNFDPTPYRESLPKSSSPDELMEHAAACLLHYIEHTQMQPLTNFKAIQLYELQAYMQLTDQARRNLELTQNLRDRKKKGSLLWVMDH